MGTGVPLRPDPLSAPRLADGRRAVGRGGGGARHRVRDLARCHGRPRRWLLERRGRNGARRAVLLATPFVLLWVRDPTLVSEPTVAALVLGVYVAFATATRDRHGPRRARRSWLVETAVLASFPLVWRDVRHGSTRSLGWAAAVAPYVAWTVRVRGHVGVRGPSPIRRGHARRRSASRSSGSSTRWGARATGGSCSRSRSGRDARARVGRVAGPVVVPGRSRRRAQRVHRPGARAERLAVPVRALAVLFTAQVLGILTWLGGDAPGAEPLSARAGTERYGRRGDVARLGLVLVVGEHDLASGPPLLDQDLPLVRRTAPRSRCAATPARRHAPGQPPRR